MATPWPLPKHFIKQTPIDYDVSCAIVKDVERVSDPRSIQKPAKSSRPSEARELIAWPANRGEARRPLPTNRIDTKRDTKKIEKGSKRLVRCHGMAPFACEERYLRNKAPVPSSHQPPEKEKKKTKTLDPSIETHRNCQTMSNDRWL